MEIKLYKLLKKYKWKLTRQQYATIKGQVKKGDFDGALIGINKILNYKNMQ